MDEKTNYLVIDEKERKKSWTHKELMDAEYRALEAKLAICVEALECKPGCKQCVNAGCDCIVDYEELVNEALGRVKDD